MLVRYLEWLNLKKMLIKKLYNSLGEIGLYRTLNKTTFYIVRSLKIIAAKRLSSFIIYFFPRHINILAFGSSLPKKKNRINYSNDLLKDFIFYELDRPYKLNEINLVMRGESLDIGLIDKSLPTFFLNPTEGDEYPEFSNRWLATADDNALRTYLGQYREKDWPGYKVRDDENIFFVYTNRYMLEMEPNIEKWNTSYVDIEKLRRNFKSKVLDDLSSNYYSSALLHKSGIPNIKLGSGVAVLVSLMMYAKKINVYGWDQYMTKDIPKKFNSQVKLLWPMDSFAFFSTCIINWIYAYRILNEQGDKVKIHGRVEMLKHVKWIQKKAFFVLYKE